MIRKRVGLIAGMILLGLQATWPRPVQPQGVHPPGVQYSASIRTIYCQCNHYGIPCTEIAILGYGFGVREVHSGNTRRTRVVVIDGKAMTDPNEYFGWDDGHIAYDIDDFVPIVVNRVYKFAIGEIVQLLNNPKNQNLVIISPEFSFRYLIKWDPGSPPQSGHTGDIIQEVACGVRPPQGDLVLMMGSTQVSKVISWGDPEGHINFVVPKMAPGTYDLAVNRGGNIVSNKKKFTVK